MDTDLTKRVVALLDPEESTPDVVAITQAEVEGLKAVVKEIDRLWKEQFTDWLKEHKEGLTVDMGGHEIRYFMGTKKRTTCRSKEGAASALLDATGGDLTGFCDVLSSMPYKYGAFKAIVGEAAFAEHFAVETVDDIKTGKPIREVKRIDSRYGKR